MPPECVVHDCKEPATRLAIVVPRVGRVIRNTVCAFHGAAIDDGAVYSWDTENHVLWPASRTALELLNVEVKRETGNWPIVTMILGNDGAESQRVSVHMTPKARGYLERAAMMSEVEQSE